MSEVVLKDLPESWEWTKLGEVIIKIVGGGTPSKNTAKYWEGNIPWLTIKDMRTQRPADTIDHITQEAVDESSTNLIPADTVIMATRVGLGKVVRVPYATTINQDLKALITPPELDKSYLEYWLVLKAQYLGSIGSGTTVKGIRLEQVKGLDFPLAPAEQQKRIVAKIEELFSHIDAGIAALKKAKQLLKQYRQSVLKAAVTGELTKQWREENKDKLEPSSQLLERILIERRQKWEAQQLEQFKAKGKLPKDDGWKGKYPEPNIDVEKFFDEPDSWAWAEIGTVTDMLSGHAFKKSEYTGSGVRLFQIANVSFGHTKWDEVEHLPESYLEDWKNISLSEGDILMALNRPLLSKRLKISRLSKADVPAILYQRVGKFQFYSELISDYFLIYMQSHFYINRLEEQLQGVNIPFINKGKLLETPISIPSSVAEMEVIVEKVNSKLDSIGRMENEIEGQLRKAAQNKQSILASAFSGGLVEGLDSDGSAQELLEEIRRQHVLNATKEKLTKKQKTAPKKADLMSKRKIIDVLKVSEQALSPEKLFDLIGADGSSPDEVEEFYIELKEALADKHVVIEPVLDGNVKNGDLISYKVEA
jgi:type I restriction enzyme S subunit